MKSFAWGSSVFAASNMYSSSLSSNLSMQIGAQYGAMNTSFNAMSTNIQNASMAQTQIVRAPLSGASGFSLMNTTRDINNGLDQSQANFTNTVAAANSNLIQQQQALLEQRTAASNEFFTVANTQIYSAGMSKGETTLGSGTSIVSGTASTGGDDHDHGHDHASGEPHGYPSAPGGVDSRLIDFEGNTIVASPNSQEMTEFRDVIQHSSFNGFDPATGNSNYSYEYKDFSVQPTGFTDTSTSAVINDIYRVGVANQTAFGNYNLPEGATVKIAPAGTNIYTVPGVCDGCSAATLNQGWNALGAHQPATNTIVVPSGYSNATLYHEIGHSVEDQIVNAPGNGLLKAQVGLGFKGTLDNPAYLTQDGKIAYNGKNSGEAFAEAYATYYTPGAGTDFHRGIVNDMDTMGLVNPDMATAINWTAKGLFDNKSGGAQGGGSLMPMVTGNIMSGGSVSFTGFGVPAVGLSGFGYTPITYQTQTAPVQSTFNGFSAISAFGRSPFYGAATQTNTAPVLAAAVTNQQPNLAKDAQNPWLREAEQKSPGTISCMDAGKAVADHGVLRFYMPNTGEHFMTKSLAEGCGAGFKFEGAKFKLSKVEGENMKPLYRCYTGTHHFVSDRSDCEGHRPEGLYGFASKTQVAGSMALHRGHHSSGDSLVTTDKSEIEIAGYGYQGILGYVMPAGADAQVATK